MPACWPELKPASSPQIRLRLIISIADRRQHSLLAHWQERLGLRAWRIELEQVSVFSVCDELCRVGNSLVGVLCDHERREATIFHTRRLTRADVVHELLHVRHPEWTEAEVNAATDRLLANHEGRKLMKFCGKDDWVALDVPEE